MKQPKLAGKVVVKFKIGADGKVSGAQASGMDDPAMKTCIAAVVSTISFPKPETGAPAAVSYPFIFSHQ